MSTLGIVDFIEARLRDDQERADGAGGQSWDANLPTLHMDGTTAGSIRPATGGRYAIQGSFANGVAHFAEHFDPARVLREVAANRAILAAILDYEATIDSEWGCCHKAEAIGRGQCPDRSPDGAPGLRALAAIWVDHPGFQPEWGVTE